VEEGAEMIDQKTHLFEELDDAREYLWTTLNALDPGVEIYIGWKKHAIFAHIAGWEAYVFDVFRDYLAGIPFKTYPNANLTDIDGANADFVAERFSVTIEGAKLECEINRFAIKALLADVPAEAFEDPVPFPWGEESLARWAEGAVQHERDHADDIVKLTR
jgi:hypothetical protein